MEWLGGTISKEDVGEEAGNNKRRREEDNDEEALGAFALRFKYVVVKILNTRATDNVSTDSSNSFLVLKH